MGALALLALSVALLAGCGLDEDSPDLQSEPTVAESTSTEPAPPPPPPAPAGQEQPSPDRREPPVGDGRGGVKLEEIGGFDQPVYVTSPPDVGADIYVVEQPGRIIRVSPDGNKSDFLDISGEISSGGERGLLSMAFAPDFKRSGRFYVDYTDPDGNTRVVEYTSSNGRRVDGSSRRELLRIDQPFANHNGGLVVFGPDDLLYIGTGDGGSGGANFGWSAFEGEDRFNSDQSAPGAVAPSLVYPTADGNCSVTGGYVVRDRRLRSLYGRYLYGDFGKGELRSFIGKPGNAREDKALGIDQVENLSSFGIDRRGRIYATSLGGSIFRIEPKG